ncbi:MAG: PEP/pyruvate-binding domain-containing protein [Desulfobacteraceae bacterium]|jgi:pyruvate,water dikinase|nr:PEP/pyruvate-binding domain-containing protein [Desulfobacteraceae bacterium]
MNWILSPEEIDSKDRHRVGGKGYATSLLVKGGFKIPRTVCITSDMYQEFVLKTGLRERILLELHRKDFKAMRWEEIWDCATRIRNMFLTKPLPDDLAQEIRNGIGDRFDGRTVAVRSSAPEEDDAQSSFAGLHESYINVAGEASILKHIRLVWSSLWSDAALLYRQEIGLDVEKSSMAVVVQETVAGDRSGVVFTRNPNDESQGVIESVYGLNQGLVDGDVEPDRWIMDRSRNTIVSHTTPERKYWIIPGQSGVRLAELPGEKSDHPPLNPQEVNLVFKTALKAEEFFKMPQDVEWTFEKESLVLLQSRPITTLRADKPEDQRSWYLSLHRSFDNLKNLRRKIEDELIPGMISVAESLSAKDPAKMADQTLAAEIRERWEINHKWVNIYWADFIPYAHGVRLFGQVYNDAVHPDDPYEFIDLLTNTNMASLERNNMLMDLAGIIRSDQQLAKKLKQGDDSGLDAEFLAMIAEFIEKFGDLSCAVTGGKNCVLGTGPLYRLLLEMADHPIQPGGRRKKDRISQLCQNYLDSFEDDQKTWAQEMLELARSSYQLRDDDNIYLGRIEAQLLAAVQEAKRRLENRTGDQTSAALSQVLEEVDFGTKSKRSGPAAKTSGYKLQARQLIGQPAGPGISKGKARVVRSHSDLADFKHGEVLVCDAVDPNITFVVPLAAAVVERRGGMLIHGAIIAREYGLPCITGIPDATTLIQTGEEITVDGYLGIVTLSNAELS